MNLFRDIVLAKGFSALQWCGLRVRIDKACTAIHPIVRMRRCLLLALLFLIQHVAFASPFGQAANQAEHLFQVRNFNEAFDKFQAIQSDPSANPADLALSRCRLGIIFSIRDDQKQARTNLELALNSNALDAGHSSLCYYALVQIYVMDKLFVEARSLMQKFPDPVFPAQYKSRVFALGTEVAKQLQDLDFELHNLDRLIRIMDTANIDRVDLRVLGEWVISKSDAQKRREDVLKQKAEIEAAKAAATSVRGATEKPLNSVSGLPMTDGEQRSVTNNTSRRNSVSNASLSHDMLQMLRDLREGVLDKVASQADFHVTHPSQKNILTHLKLEQVRERAESLLKDDPRYMRFGVILPQGSGLYSRLQLRALKGISAFINSRAARDVDFKILIRTVANDSGASERAALDLILKDKVHALIGPFHGAQFLGAAVTASFFGVPLYALGPVTSAREYDPQFTIRMGTLAQSQAKAQVQFLKRQNRKTVSILSPTDGYGVEMSKAFEAVCKAEGVQIQKVEFVDELAEIFQEPVKSLLGPQDSKIRGAEYLRLVAEGRKKAAQEKRKFDPSSIKAPAHVPFSALFVPDSLERVRLIANTFAFYDAKSIRFLGDRTWQEAGGKQSIADQFLNGARVPVPVSGSFLPYLRRELAAGESIIDIERQAFDSLLLVRTAQYKAGGNNPAKIVAAMRSQDFKADGASRYGAVDPSGEPLIQFEVTKFHNGSVLSPNSANGFEEESTAQDTVN